MWGKCRTSLQQLVREKHEKEKLLDARLVFVWWGYDTVKQPQTAPTDLKITLVSLHYLKPWRPTFVALTPATAIEEKKLLEMGGTGHERIHTEGTEDYITLRIQQADGQAMIHTQLSFLHTLAKNKRWRVTRLQLSSRCTPFLDSAACVRVCVLPGAPLLSFWSGFEKHSQENDPDDDDDDAEDDDDNDELHAGDAEEIGIDKKNLKEESQGSAAQKGDFTTDLQDGLETLFTPELLALWDDLTKESHSSNTSSSSDSSSSSSSSSSSTQSSASTKLSTKKRQRSESAGAEVKVEKSAKRDLQRGFSYGPHHIVPRFKGEEITGYQLTCKHAHHIKCSKEIACSVAGSPSHARRLLKAWALMGHSAASRDEHMGPKLKKSLLLALSDHTLLSETELDSIMSSLDEEEAVAPFAPPPVTAPLKADKAVSTLLGQAGDVPQHIHEEMRALRRNGVIPETTLSQRLRNRPATDTSYSVPTDMRSAALLGYVGPNLTPPPGLIWRFKGGVWRLCPRGG